MTRTDIPNIVLITANLNGTEDSHGCWEWRGNLAVRYPRTSVGGKMVSVHRFMYEFCFGVIPDGMVVMHKCDNSRCANPRHLAIGTPLDNNRDMINKGRQRYSNRKLTPEQVRLIRSDQRRQKDIAADYGITQSAVAHVKTRRSWAHLPD